jgi:dihydrolipoamide dehydrogenase
MLDEYDVVVIGGGGGGFMTAFRAGQLGGKVLIIEKREKVGGVCMFWGCIPVCLLSRCAEAIKVAKEVGNQGIHFGEPKIDYKQLMGEKDKLVNMVSGGMVVEMEGEGVEVVTKASGKLISVKEVEISFDNGEKKVVRAKNIVLATGLQFRRYDIPGAYGEGVLTARELIDLDEQPKSLIIIGRSVVALEFATIWNQLGTDVTIVARTSEFLPGEDEDFSPILTQSLKESGVHIYSDVNIEEIGDSVTGKSVAISSNGVKQKVEAQFVVFALGQRPWVDGQGFEEIGIEISDGGIKTNEKMETSVKGIYAVGDVTGVTMQANVALYRDAIIAGENAMGGNTFMDYRVVPRFARTFPPVAAVGITEQEAKSKGMNVKVHKFPFAKIPKAHALMDISGFLKIVADASSGEILGVHIIGPEAPELIHEGVMAMKTKSTFQDLMKTIHNHPTLHEIYWRAAQDMCGREPLSF